MTILDGVILENTKYLIDFIVKNKIEHLLSLVLNFNLCTIYGLTKS